jgi:hypothetical protein
VGVRQGRSEQLLRLLRVADTFVLVTVVEEHVGLGHLAGQLLDRIDELLQFLVRVEVVEPLGRCASGTRVRNQGLAFKVHVARYPKLPR